MSIRLAAALAGATVAGDQLGKCAPPSTSSENQGCRAEARDLLAAVYGWVTEDFDTPDLKR
jgi:hypothetical protein